MEKKKLGSYQHEKQLRLKKKHMTTRTEDQELKALVELRDEDIDTSDIPEVKDWSRAVVGRFYRPIKAPVTLRVDVDVLDWLKSEGPGYQTRLNTVLRTAMARSTVGALDVREGAVAACAGAPRELRFPSLEKHGELEKCNRIAHAIEIRHSVFAPTL